MDIQKSEVRDGMQIDWDVPIEMEDGVVLRADVFRPTRAGKFPVMLAYAGWLVHKEAALPDARSLRAAFEQAKSAIAARERREHVDASKPQAYFGAALEAKLAAMGTAAP